MLIRWDVEHVSHTTTYHHHYHHHYYYHYHTPPPLTLTRWDIEHVSQAEAVIFEALGFGKMESYP
eukprot:scaffold82101_cov57-Phaeocystis_antarctica.AAC.2